MVVESRVSAQSVFSCLRTMGHNPSEQQLWKFMARFLLNISIKFPPNNNPKKFPTERFPLPPSFLKILLEFSDIS